MSGKIKWEIIYDNSEEPGNYWEATYRSKIIGGWLIKHEIFYDYQYFGNDNNHKEIGEEWIKKELSIVFVPDHNHEWEIE